MSNREADAGRAAHVIVDAGSTLSKIAVLSAGHEVLQFDRVAYNDIGRFLSGGSARTELPWFMSEASNPDLMHTLEGALSGNDVGYRVIRKAGSLPFENLYAPGQAGTDRLADAAWACHEKIFPAVLVDVGSAITIDVVDAGGAFAGGAIMPGIALQLKALQTGSTRLQIPGSGLVAGNPGYPAQDTERAIASGIWNGVSGAIKEMVLQARRIADSDSTPVIVTGGDGHQFTGSVELPVSYDPHLTVKGLSVLARHRFPGSGYTD